MDAATFYEKEANRLAAEVKQLRAVLEPFAKAATGYVHSHEATRINERPAWAGKDYVDVFITAGDLRRAAIALNV